MAQPKITQAEFDRRLNALCEAIRAGYSPPRTSVPRGGVGALAKAADACNVHRSSFSNWYFANEMRITLPEAAPAPVADIAPIAQAAPAEMRDASWWRKRAAILQGDLEETRHALREVSGLAGQSIFPPEWAVPTNQGDAQRAVGLLYISDTHVGEVVRSEEVNGLNQYNPHIFQARLKRLIEATLKIVPRWASDCRLQGIVVALNGDLISGDIHDELRRTNALSSNDQVLLCAAEFAAAFRLLANAFGKVWVVVTPGNHGRSTEKTHAKRTAALSYDSLIGQIIKQHFSSDPRIVVHIAPGRDAVYPILGHTVFQSHGDALGAGGGQGFAGPGLPIIRGSKKVEYVGMVVDQRYEIILTAHYHSSMNIGRVFANGSMIGWNEFALSIRATPEPPQQWLMLVTERWGVRERAEIKLEAPAKPEQPRIRVQARSA